jgi:hypothetical protein
MRPVFPQQQTSLRSVATSAKCQKQTSTALQRAVWRRTWSTTPKSADDNAALALLLWGNRGTKSARASSPCGGIGAVPPAPRFNQRRLPISKCE